jgi:DNA-binding MarR family transcriptional regulator
LESRTNHFTAAEAADASYSARDIAELSDLILQAVRPKPSVSRQNFLVRDSSLVGVAEELYRIRRKRDALFADLFGEGLFADPAWDLLLDLYIQTSSHRKISVSSACVAAAVPTTTALRYVSDLIRRGLIERSPHPGDGRSHLLSLTIPAIKGMEKLLRQLQPQLAAQPETMT